MELVRRVESIIGDVIIETIRPSDIQRLAKKMLPTAKNSTRNRNVIGPARAVINCAADSEGRAHIKIKNFQEEEVVKLHPSEGAAELLMA